jgi:hypothetical protein
LEIDAPPNVRFDVNADPGHVDVFMMVISGYMGYIFFCHIAKDKNFF